ncbi:MAG: phosphate ABC transporter permease PstA [Pseudomonadota bacterium]
MADPKEINMSHTGALSGVRVVRTRRIVDRVLKGLAISCVGLSIAFLAVIILSVVSISLRALTQYQLFVVLTPTLERLLPESASNVSDIGNNMEGFNTLVLEEVHSVLGEPLLSDSNHIELFAPLAVASIAEATAESPNLLGVSRQYRIPISSVFDQYLKGQIADESFGSLSQASMFSEMKPSAAGRASGDLYSVGFREMPRDIKTAMNRKRADLPSIFVETDNAIFQVISVADDQLILEKRVGDIVPEPDRIDYRVVWTPEVQRAILDQQIAEVNYLKRAGVIRPALNLRFLSSGDSTYPELAGILAALVGSFLTLIVTALISVPIGIMAAIWLEEFAPRNRLTTFIEVNINNLAAVPSIVFGLLGAAVLLNFFGLPRSAPIVGGLVLALLTLPTVIIASRAALNAVSQDIRTAALSLGASPMQMVIDHVLPVAAPGIITGVILGLARSLGETAPLLLIGMVVFIGEVPSGVGDEATTLPVLIYKWSTGAERAWEPLTAATIVVLLIILVLMNVLASYLRQRYERR